MTTFVQSGYARSSQFGRVRRVADELLLHLNRRTVLRRIALANVPGRSSAGVQETFLRYARDLGFVDESRGLFASYPTSALRPDYYMPIGRSGILLEVERGKTTINNMDLLDFWKCHLCDHANYLFLMVPRALRQNELGSTRNEYAAVVKRLSSFLEERNHTNVRALFVFGY